MIAWTALGLYIAMFLIVFVARSMIQKRRTGDSGIRAGGLDGRPGSIEWIAAWLLVLALVGALGAPIAELVGLDELTSARSIRWIGAAIAIAGIALTFMAQINMGSEWRIGVDEAEQTGLVTGGAFALVRNPIFSAILIAATGLTLMVPNVLSIAGLGLAIISIELQVRLVEEPHLRRLHGDDYARYAERVGRFAPGIGRS